MVANTTTLDHSTPAAGPPLDPVTDAAGVVDAAEDWQRIAMGYQSEAEVLRADFEAAEAGRAELALEVAALRGAMPDAGLLEFSSRGIPPLFGADERAALRKSAARIRALSAPAPAAETEAGTGGEWTREAPTEPGKYWATFNDYDLGIIQDDTLTAAVVYWNGAIADYDGSPVDVLLWGARFYRPTPPPGWREALAALDTPQEADHAR